MKLMKKIFRIGMAMGLAAILVSCVSVKKLADLNPVYVTNMKQINLLPTAAIAGDIDTIMQLNGKFGDQAFTDLTYVQADESGIYMSLMNDFGTEMGDLTYDGLSVVFDSAMFPSDLPAEYIINDFQNAFYNVEDLKMNLNASKLNFVIEKADAVEVRKIFDGKKLIEEIILDGENVTIKNHLRGYEFNLVVSE